MCVLVCMANSKDLGRKVHVHEMRRLPGVLRISSAIATAITCTAAVATATFASFAMCRMVPFTEQHMGEQVYIFQMFGLQGMLHFASTSSPPTIIAPNSPTAIPTTISIAAAIGAIATIVTPAAITSWALLRLVHWPRERMGREVHIR